MDHSGSPTVAYEIECLVVAYLSRLLYTLPVKSTSNNNCHCTSATSTKFTLLLQTRRSHFLWLFHFTTHFYFDFQFLSSVCCSSIFPKLSKHIFFLFNSTGVRNGKWLKRIVNYLLMRSEFASLNAKAIFTA